MEHEGPKTKRSEEPVVGKDWDGLGRRAKGDVRIPLSLSAYRTLKLGWLTSMSPLSPFAAFSALPQPRDPA